MFKKFIATLITAFMITPAFAALYAGGSLGIITNTSKNGSYRGALPMMHLGYDEMGTPEIYLAIEMFGTPSTISISDNTGTADSLRSTRMIGASFIPGVTITENVLAFLRLGIVNTLFTGANTSRTGLNAGIGLATQLTDYWHLRMEYDYAAYKSQNQIGATKSDQFMISLIYHFL